MTRASPDLESIYSALLLDCSDASNILSAGKYRLQLLTGTRLQSHPLEGFGDHNRRRLSCVPRCFHTLHQPLEFGILIYKLLEYAYIFKSHCFNFFSFSEYTFAAKPQAYGRSL